MKPVPEPCEPPHEYGDESTSIIEKELPHRWPGRSRHSDLAPATVRA
jgi:hypothetical protein